MDPESLLEFCFVTFFNGSILLEVAFGWRWFLAVGNFDSVSVEKFAWVLHEFREFESFDVDFRSVCF